MSYDSLYSLSLQGNLGESLADSQNEPWRKLQWRALDYRVQSDGTDDRGTGSNLQLKKRWWYRPQLQQESTQVTPKLLVWQRQSISFCVRDTKEETLFKSSWLAQMLFPVPENKFSTIWLKKRMGSGKTTDAAIPCVLLGWAYVTSGRPWRMKARHRIPVDLWSFNWKKWAFRRLAIIVHPCAPLHLVSEIYPNEQGLCRTLFRHFSVFCHASHICRWIPTVISRIRRSVQSVDYGPRSLSFLILRGDYRSNFGQYSYCLLYSSGLAGSCQFDMELFNEWRCHGAAFHPSIEHRSKLHSHITSGMVAALFRARFTWYP